MEHLGLCEMRWKKFSETTTEEGHKLVFVFSVERSSQGNLNTVMGCRPVSSRQITIRLRAVPLNITVVQAYASTSDNDDNKIEWKEDILVIQRDWNAKVGTDAYENWQGICGPFCNDDTNERGLRLL